MSDANGTGEVKVESQTGTQQGDPNGNPGPADTGTQKPNDGQGADKSAVTQPADPFAELNLEADTREWLEKRGVKGVGDAVKLAREQDKLLGNAIRVPGKDAKPEEVEAYLNKLGRPETADKYELAPPEKLPEDLPYDGERAKSFKDLAHKLGLTQQQAKSIHDWAAENAVNDFTGAQQAKHAKSVEIAKGETEKLVKLWGPLDGETMKTNLAFADKVLTAGGPEAVNEFRRVGLIGEGGDKVIMSAPIATMLAKVGAALFKEDEVLRGDPSRLNNPFADGEHFNATAQMRLVKQDEANARSLIAAAGKKPEDFGLKAS